MRGGLAVRAADMLQLAPFIDGEGTERIVLGAGHEQTPGEA